MRKILTTHRRQMAAIWALAFLILGTVVWASVPAKAAEPEDQVAIYLYPLLDPSAPPSWENSGQQILLDVWDSTDWYPGVPALPEGLCDGHLYGIQQDKAHVPPNFVWPATLRYPDVTVGIPLYASKHQTLTSLVEVPACVTETPTPTQEPSVTPEPTTSVNPPVQAAPPTTPRTTLASTGLNGEGVFLGVALVVLGGTLIGIARRNRKPRHWVRDGMTD